jgi:hypothetical protein
VFEQVALLTIDSPSTLIETALTSRLILKASDIAGYRATWNWAAYFYQYLNVPGIGLTLIDKKNYLPTRDPVLFTPTTFLPSYQLKIVVADWIDSFTLTLYQDTMPLNFEPVVNIPSQVASASVSATIPLSTTSIAVVAANTNRKKLTIANNSNQDLYIDFDATASIADHAIKIPKVSANGFIATYEIEAYAGQVSAIWAAAGAGAALVREFV